MLEATPVQFSLRASRFNGFGGLVRLLAGTACAFAVLGVASASHSAVVYGTVADIVWTAAPGSVSHYGVWVSHAKTILTIAPTFVTQLTQASITSRYGHSIVTRVAAFYTDGTWGPFSPPSDVIHFVPNPTAPYDFDGNGTVDFVLHGAHDDTRKAVLLGSIGVIGESFLPAAQDDGWRVSGSTDFNADGHADLLMWHPDTGAAELWLMDGASRTAVLSLTARGKGWYPRALGDYAPSGAARLLWTHHTTGETELWLMGKNTIQAKFDMLTMAAGWEIWGTCDVDGDGSRDVVWVDEQTDEARLWLMGSEDSIDEVDLEHPGHGYTMRACGDFDRDRSETLVWQRDNELVMWEMTNVEGNLAVGAHSEITIPDSHLVGQAGDHDGDGDADLLLINSTSGSLKIRKMYRDILEHEIAVQLDPAPHFEITSW